MFWNDGMCCVVVRLTLTADLNAIYSLFLKLAQHLQKLNRRLRTIATLSKLID